MQLAASPARQAACLLYAPTTFFHTISPTTANRVLARLDLVAGGCRQCEAGSADGSAAPVRTSSGVLSLTRETSYRVGSVGQDCQLLLWDFIISDDYTGASMDQR